MFSHPDLNDEEETRRYTLSDVLVGGCVLGYVVAFFTTPLRDDLEQDRILEEQRIESLDDIRNDRRSEAIFELPSEYSFQTLRYDMPAPKESMHTSQEYF